MSKVFELYSQEKLPEGFRYPARLIELARTGGCPDIYPWWFIDASTDSGRLSFSIYEKVPGSLIPFAKLDYDEGSFACFDGKDTSGNPRVREWSLSSWPPPETYKDFDEWLVSAEDFSRRMRG